MASPFDGRYSDILSRIRYYANRYGIPENVGIWQIWYESSFNPTVCSYANACGIAQFIPDTARRYGVDRNNIESSLDGWGRYMRYMLDMFNGRIDIALAGYNSGENRNEYRAAARENRPINWNVMPDGVQSQTQSYVNKIMRSAGTAVTPVVSQQLASNVSHEDSYANYINQPDGNSDTALWLGLGFLALILFA